MDIKNELIEHISQEGNNGALLLTGNWGCGKSYLVKELVKELNESEEYAFAVISTFGIDTVDALNQRIKDEYLEHCSGLLGKTARKTYRVLKNVTKETSKITAAALPDSVVASAINTGVSSVLSFDPLSLVKVKNTVGIGEKVRKFILIIDDFERCNIPKKQLMGVINEYTENKLIKTILIADEEKIEEQEYLEFKEKLISRTLKINPNHEKTIESIVARYSENDKVYKGFLTEKMACLQGAYNNSGYNNLRILKACIFDFRRVYMAWKKSMVPMDDIENVFYKFCAITYETKAGNYKKNKRYSLYGISIQDGDEKERERKAQEIRDKYVPETFDYVLRSLSRWVVDGEWNEEYFVSEITNKYVEAEISHEEKFIKYNFWDLQQEDIDIGMPKLVEKAYAGEATCDELISLLQKTHALKIHDFSLPCDVDYEKIEDAFDIRKSKIRNGEITEPNRHKFSENNELDAEAIQLYKKIEKVESQIYVWSNRQLLISYFKQEKNANRYNLRNLCLDVFDEYLYNLFIKIYDGSLNGDKRDLCWILTGIDFYNNNFSNQDDKKTTAEYFEKLIKHLDEQIDENKDQMTTAISKQFETILEEKIKLLNED